jgi:hypothetical protein
MQGPVQSWHEGRGHLPQLGKLFLKEDTNILMFLLLMSTLLLPTPSFFQVDSQCERSMR